MLLTCVFGFGDYGLRMMLLPVVIMADVIAMFHLRNNDNFSIVGREDQNLIRAIKEAIYIRVKNPSLNRNIGKYHLPDIWDEVLNNIPELKLK